VISDQGTRSHLAQTAKISHVLQLRSSTAKINIAETDVEELTNIPLFFKYLLLFIYLAVLDLSCSTWDILAVCARWDRVP